MEESSTSLQLDREPETEEPIIVEGLAGIGHIGRNVVSYIAEHLEAEKIGEINSNHFPPYTIVKDDKTVEMIKNNIFEVKRDDKPDLILVEGKAQSSTPQGHHEIAQKIQKFAEQAEASKIFTIGGYGTGDVVENPDVFGAVNNEKLKEQYSEYDIEFDHDVGQIVGVSGLLIALAGKKGIDGVCLLGETPGFLLSDPKSTENVLERLENILELDLDYSNLDDKVEESQDVLKKLQNLKKQDNADKDQGQSDLGYIG